MSTLEYRSVEIEPGDASWWSWIGWAIYLGMSWTWCVGMFLPVLLVRDYGFWGWVVFAIPNVVGAAAVGWINRTAKQSKQTVAAHRLAMIAFSVVTATFQIFFAFWFFQRLIPDPPRFLNLIVAFSLLAIAFPIAARCSLGIAVACLVCVGSILCITEVFGSGQLITFSVVGQAATQANVKPEILILAASTCFGFLTCPHLDLTFHHARQAMSANGARVAFGLGLGLIFAAMIVFSLLYSDSVVGGFVDPGYLNRAFLWGLSAYMLLQVGFTTGIHWEAAGRAIGGSKLNTISVLVGSTLVGVLAALIALSIYHPPLEGGEIVYRIFLSFYGLLFPAYIWICMLPGRWIWPPLRQQWIALSVAVVVAAPMFWMGFIERKMIWIIPGLAVPLAARLFIRSPVQQ